MPIVKHFLVGFTRKGRITRFPAFRGMKPLGIRCLLMAYVFPEVQCHIKLEIIYPRF